MPLLSAVRASWPVLTEFPSPHRGKVRDTYDLGNGLLLVVCTDGISIFDFVLNALIPDKGQVLTAMTHFWSRLLGQHGIRMHFVAMGDGIDTYLPEEMRGDKDLQSRAAVVRKLTMHPVEFIGRVLLGGSVLKEYLKTGTVYGTPLPPGHQDGDELPYILDTPTTKAEVGHDMPLNAADIRRKYPAETHLLINMMQIISQAARQKGIQFADSKFEMGLDGEGNLTLGDEIATPDSSRFFDLAEWRKSRAADKRKSPPPFDKQLVRAWGIEQGIDPGSNKFDPKNEDDVRQVQQLVVPLELIRATSQTYRYILWRLTGRTLERYQRYQLGVALPPRKRRLVLVFGSDSDIPKLGGVLNNIAAGGMPDISAHVISCHRNPTELRNFVQDGCDGADAIVAAGGMAFALPGVLDALIYESGKHIPVVGVALGQPESEAHQAALLSISQLPGAPVVMDEVAGRVYSGADGFYAACDRVLNGELPPQKARAKKPAQANISTAQFFANRS